MKKNLTDFYKNLPPFTDFRKVTSLENYVEVPEGWSVVMTDVKGSTQAIQEGRCRDVNMLGAAGIAAIKNAIKKINQVDMLPFVFGGDGATFLVPEAFMEKVAEALRGTQAQAKEMFNLELRAGAVPIEVLKAADQKVLVAKYELSPGNELAQFMGGGIAKAEEMVKKQMPGAILFEPDEKTPAADLSGLSCRWEPFKTKKGTMLSLLVQVQPSQQEITYQDILTAIELKLGHELKHASPVQ